MTTRTKNFIIVLLMAALVFGFWIVNILSPGERYSMSERRLLASFPEVSGDNLINGKFTSEFETYSQDQFPFRDSFRRLKSLSARYLFGQKDNNGYYTWNGYVSRLNFPLDESRLSRRLDQLEQVYRSEISGSDCSMYLSIIPDKNYFLAPLGNYPTMDYETLVKQCCSRLDFASYIDIFPLLTLEDYYRTDQHWDQTRIIPVAEFLAASMGTEIETHFLEVNPVGEGKNPDETGIPFWGAYVGQAALDLPPDSLRCLTSDTLEQCLVTSWDTGEPRPASLYNREKAFGRDPYEVFLDGSTPLICIENPASSTDKELVVFRDSFAGSLIPLMASGYKKITLVDLRYLNSSLLGNYIEFSNQDVLFLYSTLILNS